jgi:hypothetical protein
MWCYVPAELGYTILKQGIRLTLFKNRMLRSMFGLQGQGATFG